VAALEKKWAAELDAALADAATARAQLTEAVREVEEERRKAGLSKEGARSEAQVVSRERAGLVGSDRSAPHRTLTSALACLSVFVSRVCRRTWSRRAGR
jgi:hypothetical protein